MSTLIPVLNHGAEVWVTAMTAVLWQSILLVAVALAIARLLLRRSSPTVRYWLWQIVALKLLLMPFWTLALPLPSWATLRTTNRPATVAPIGERTRNLQAAPTIHLDASATDSGTMAQPSAAIEKPLPPIAWQTGLLFAWAVMVLLLVGRLFVQRHRLAALLRRSVPVDPDMATMVAELAGQIRLHRVPVAVSVAGDCPLFVCGLVRPRIVLPEQVLAALGQAEQRQVVLHELGHLKRGDLIWGWPVEIAKIVYFFHPLVYWVAAQLRLERELACDQLAMVHSGGTPSSYAKTLIEVVRRASDAPLPQTAGLSASLAEEGPRT